MYSFICVDFGVGSNWERGKRDGVCRCVSRSLYSGDSGIVGGVRRSGRRATRRLKTGEV